ELSGWLSVDPLAREYPSISPYCSVANNSIKFIDPDGNRIIAVGAISQFYVKTYLKEHFGISRAFKVTSSREVKINQRRFDKQYYDFADPVNDTKDIENKVITKVVFVSDKQIKSMLNSQGAFESGMFNFCWESQGGGGGDFDYSFTVLPNIYHNANFDGSKSNSLFIPEGDYMAHNFMNFGNYLWGATGGYTVGFEYGELQLGAHFNSLFNSARNGYPSQWDSKDDQRSIIKGAFHAQTHDYKSLRK
ncbi:MAG: hypothetical protein QMD02_06815, partial [Bacteroidales bacterium]|nr:hypothetical protein [Bacteroidales bacterium]